MNKSMRSVIVIISILTIGLTISAKKITKENIALEKKYTLSRKPNYSLTGDSGDMRQLTDGKYADAVGKTIWVQKASVAWSALKFQPLAIAIDLERVEPIDTVVFSTSAREFSGLWWPMVISLRVSMDGRSFYEIGNMVRLSREAIPSSTGAFKHRFTVSGLKTKAKWVMLVVQSSIMAVCDEIEIYRGDSSASTEVYKTKPVGLEMFANANYMTQEGCARRFNLDLGEVSRRLTTVKWNKKSSRRLSKIKKKLQDEIINTRFPASAKEFRAIVPYNDLHRRILALNAYVLQAKGFKGLSVWKNDRYAPLSWFDSPPKLVNEPKPSITTMLNEHRADVINLSNATNKAMTVSFSINNLPGGTNPAYLVPHQVEFVDTREGVVYASALVKLSPKNGTYTTNVPAGMTRQIWLASYVKDVKPGKYIGEINLTSSTGKQTVPLKLKIYPMTMPDQLDTRAGIWDYTIAPCYMVSKKNVKACLADLRSHYINLPWGSTWQIMFPRPEYFDKKGNLIKNLDFTAYDKWIKTWPKAKRYMVLLAAHPGRKFGERFPRGTKEFNNGLTQWAAAWQKHNQKLGLKPGRVCAQFVDEVHNHDQLVTSLQWSKAFRAGAPDIALFNDPLLTNIAQKDWHLFEELLKYTDIVCPQPVQYFRMSDKRRETIQSFIKDKNKELWFYMCSGPVRKFNPAYYRLQPQYGYSVNAVGSSFWAYGDGRCKSSWNEYPGVGNVGFTPVYLDSETVTTGKHWEAFREGLEDTQYLIMLANKSKYNVSKVKRLLSGIVFEYKKTANLGFDWRDAKACSTADKVRKRVLKLLSKAK